VKKLLFAAVICTYLGDSFAQNEDDALRYSHIFFGGSARHVSTAGAFGAVGGDYSLVSVNPAGLARFRKHNFSFTPVVENLNASAAFYGTRTKEHDLDANIANISYIKAYNLDPPKFNNWYGVQMGVGYNRIHSFEESIHYTGTSDSSILHSFIKMANGTSPAQIYTAFPFDAGLAYDTYALDPGPDNTYVTDFTSGNAVHDRTVYRKGGMGEYTGMISANYGNKLYLGGSVNLTKVNYKENFEHKETYTNDSLWIQSIRYLYNIEVEGWGYGVRAGAIYLPYEWMRIGISVQSPTLFRLSDYWSSNFYTNTDDGLKFVDESNVPVGRYDYRVRTPFRSNISLGLVSKKLGSIGVDVEYVDHTTSVLSSRTGDAAPYSFITENAQVKNIYRSVINFKMGAELRIEQFYIRGGFANYASPYREGKGNEQYPVRFFTGGFGYNLGHLYLDFAVVTRFNTADYYAYDPTLAGSHAVINTRNISCLMTLGYRWPE
jgi:hypothetical protein